MLLVRRRQDGIFGPELGAQVSVRGSQGKENGLDKVTHGTGVTTGTAVAIFHSRHVQELLTGGRRDQPGTTRCRDETNSDGAALASDLARDRVGKTVGTSPVSAADGNDIQFGRRNGTTNGVGHFGRALDSESNVSIVVTNGDKSLESRALTGTGLLLDGHDFHDFVLELVLEEKVNDFGFLDGKGKEKDFFNGTNLSFLDETSELGDGHPDVFFVPASASASPSSASPTASTASTTAKATAASAAAAATCSLFS